MSRSTPQVRFSIHKKPKVTMAAVIHNGKLITLPAIMTGMNQGVLVARHNELSFRDCPSAVPPITSTNIKGIAAMVAIAIATVVNEPIVMLAVLPLALWTIINSVFSEQLSSPTNHIQTVKAPVLRQTAKSVKHIEHVTGQALQYGGGHITMKVFVVLAIVAVRVALDCKYRTSRIHILQPIVVYLAIAPEAWHTVQADAPTLERNYTIALRRPVFLLEYKAPLLLEWRQSCAITRLHDPTDRFSIDVIVGKSFKRLTFDRCDKSNYSREMTSSGSTPAATPLLPLALSTDDFKFRGPICKPFLKRVAHGRLESRRSRKASTASVLESLDRLIRNKSLEHLVRQFMAKTLYLDIVPLQSACQGLLLRQRALHNRAIIDSQLTQLISLQGLAKGVVVRARNSLVLAGLQTQAVAISELQAMARALLYRRKHRRQLQEIAHAKAVIWNYDPRRNRVEVPPPRDTSPEESERYAIGVAQQAQWQRIQDSIWKFTMAYPQVKYTCWPSGAVESNPYDCLDIMSGPKNFNRFWNEWAFAHLPERFRHPIVEAQREELSLSLWVRELEKGKPFLQLRPEQGALFNRRQHKQPFDKKPFVSMTDYTEVKLIPHPTTEQRVSFNVGAFYGALGVSQHQLQHARQMWITQFGKDNLDPTEIYALAQSNRNVEQIWHSAQELIQYGQQIIDQGIPLTVQERSAHSRAEALMRFEAYHMDEDHYEMLRENRVEPPVHWIGLTSAPPIQQPIMLASLDRCGGVSDAHHITEHETDQSNAAHYFPEVKQFSIVQKLIRAPLRLEASFGDASRTVTMSETSNPAALPPQCLMMDRQPSLDTVQGRFVLRGLGSSCIQHTSTAAASPPIVQIRPANPRKQQSGYVTAGTIDEPQKAQVAHTINSKLNDRWWPSALRVSSLEASESTEKASLTKQPIKRSRFFPSTRAISVAKIQNPSAFKFDLNATGPWDVSSRKDASSCLSQCGFQREAGKGRPRKSRFF